MLANEKLQHEMYVQIQDMVDDLCVVSDEECLNAAFKIADGGNVVVVWKYMGNVWADTFKQNNNGDRFSFNEQDDIWEPVDDSLNIVWGEFSDDGESCKLLDIHVPGWD